MPLPVVKEDLLYGIQASIKEEGFLKKIAARIDSENPVVSEMIVRHISQADAHYGYNSAAGNMVLAAMMTVYHMLSAQADCDDLGGDE